jgi:AraC family transcriptional regulator, regulatory protein of adaptative response / methylated-DNA-[protein]-cysteine methyltransferase
MAAYRCCMTTHIATSPAEAYGTTGTQSEAGNDGMTGTQSAQRLWDAVLARDARSDGRFVYAVRSTGVYCRPSCPSRRPNRDSVRFFPGPDAAEVAGFRECRRCHPRAGVAPAPGLDNVRKAAAYIASHADEPITLSRLAGHVRTSPFHLQRIFTRILGISPRAYQDALRAQRFRHDLRKGKPLTSAIYDAGYGSSSRVYEQQPTGRGMTPAEYRRGAKGTAVAFTIVDSSLGRLLVAGTEKGLCSVKLGDRDDLLESDLRGEYPSAEIRREQGAFSKWVRTLVAHLDGRAPKLDLPVDVQATAFQWKVWRHLQSIPYGETRAYSQVAKDLGVPSATRAVARACATNRVCLVIPCHRVLQKGGGLGGYRWGIERKRKLLQKEKQ